jgi:sugar lactone lactonase YvrE
VAAGNLWVANMDTGDLVRMDSRTHRLLQTVHLGESGNGGAPLSLVTDGQIVWASTRDGVVWRIDGATGERLSLLQLPTRDPHLFALDTSRRVLYAGAYDGTRLLEIDADQRGPDWTGRELRLGQRADRNLLTDLAVGPDSLWAATLNPDQLLRIDPDTFTISGRMPLAGVDHESDSEPNLASGGGAIWVRIKGKVLELSPPDR